MIQIIIQNRDRANTGLFKSEVGSNAMEQWQITPAVCFFSQSKTKQGKSVDNSLTHSLNSVLETTVKPPRTYVTFQIILFYKDYLKFGSFWKLCFKSRLERPSLTASLKWKIYLEEWIRTSICAKHESIRHVASVSKVGGGGKLSQKIWTSRKKKQKKGEGNMAFP